MRLSVDKNGWEESAMILKLNMNSTKNPKQIDFIHEEGPLKGKTDLGIYMFEGNRLTLCMSDRQVIAPRLLPPKKARPFHCLC